ncbi:hypothetical protein Y032_0220g2524 [Ancylostoma ceylanicum]|uniref:Uncharacterized protein n=1 Tax=Ancylostoma ceylanicum TaxID=53326 RepID=A0A016SIH9_9BILA|nr:hypothetical protein Y032_0220g2524 [Ancylostoma ceylanicum]
MLSGRSSVSMTLGCGRTTIIRHLQALGYRKLMPTWVSHELSASQLAVRVSVCESLLLRPHKRDFPDKSLLEMRVGRCMLIIHDRKIASEWRTTSKEPKGELHEEKVLLCCWWDSEGMLDWKLLPSGYTVSTR